MEREKRVIIAGAEGFIGGGLVPVLKKAGYAVTALTHRTGTVEGADKVVVSEGKDNETLAEELKPYGYDGFFCLAWRGTSGPLRADHTVQTQNIETACRYAELAACVQCAKFIFASSINEFEAAGCLASENCTPPRGYVYGAAKLAARMMTQTIAANSGLPFISALFTNVYGERKDTGRLIRTSVKKLINGEHCAFTEGTQTYDFIYITDAAGALLSILEAECPQGMYYIGSGRPAPLKDFLAVMGEEVAPYAVLGFGEIPFRGYSPDYTVFDTDRVKRETGYKNKVTFREGIGKTAEQIRKEGLENGNTEI